MPRPQCPLLLLMRRHCHARAIQFRSPRTLSRRACLLRTWHVMEVPGWFASHCQELNAVPASASGRGCRYTCAALSPNVHMNDERRRAWHRACTSIPATSNRIEISWRPWPLGPGLGLRRPHPHASRTSESRDIREFIGRARRARGSPALTGLAPPHNRCRGIVNGRAKTIACAHVLGISTLSFPLDAHWQCARPGLQGETPPQTHRLVRPWIAASVSRSIAYWVMPSPIQFVFSMFSTPAPRAHTSAWLAPANIPVIPGTNSESFASTMEACATLRACLNLIPVLFLFYGSCNVSAINQDTVQRRRGTSSDNHWHQRLTHRNFDEGSERCAHMVAVRSEWSPSCAFAIHSIPMWGVRPYRAGPGTVVRGSQPMREAERLRFRLRSPRRPLDRVCVRVAQEGQCVPRLAVWPIVSATCREFPVFDRPA